MKRLKFLLHNVVFHPICGLLWVTGHPRLSELADQIHETTGRE